MNSITLLEHFFADVHVTFHAVAGDLTEQEWKSQPVSGQNTLGFIAWHIPRIQDNIIQTWIRGIPELAHGERWKKWQPFRHLGSGTGIPTEGAHEIGHLVEKVDVLNYANEVYQEVVDWLRVLNDDDLERIPDSENTLKSYPEYQTPGYLNIAADLIGQPIWVLVMSVCIGHVHRHLGELSVMKEILREGK